MIVLRGWYLRHFSKCYASLFLLQIRMITEIKEGMEKRRGMRKKGVTEGGGKRGRGGKGRDERGREGTMG